jgi:uncharacterized membrane protein YGL010W
MTTAIPRSPAEAYESSHRHPANRALHAVGIPLIAFGVIAALVGPRAGIPRRTAVAGIAAGWGLLFLGHAMEGNRPAIFSNWRAPLDALRWWGGSAREACAGALSRS